MIKFDWWYLMLFFLLSFLSFIINFVFLLWVLCCALIPSHCSLLKQPSLHPYCHPSSSLDVACSPFCRSHLSIGAVFSSHPLYPLRALVPKGMNSMQLRVWFSLILCSLLNLILLRITPRNLIMLLALNFTFQSPLISLFFIINLCLWPNSCRHRFITHNM